MRLRLLSIVLSACAIGSAEARIDVRTLTCAEAQALVRREGAIVLTTGQYTYERFVAHQGFCQRGEERTERRRAATRDDDACWISYVCARRDFRLRRS